MSTDSIRKIERNRQSPTIETIRKLCDGLELPVSTFFAGLERGRRDELEELVAYLRRRPQREQRRAWRVIRAMFDDP